MLHSDYNKMAPPVADLKAMTDAFEGIDRLAEGAPRTEGAPNFRRVSGGEGDVILCWLAVSSVTNPAWHLLCNVLHLLSTMYTTGKSYI